MPLRGVTGTFATEFSEKGKAKPQGTQLSKREGAAEMQDKKKRPVESSGGAKYLGERL